MCGWAVEQRFLGGAAAGEAAGRGGGGPCMQGFVSCTPSAAFRILPGEAGPDAGAGAEGIENATPTENP